MKLIRPQWLNYPAALATLLQLIDLAASLHFYPGRYSKFGGGSADAYTSMGDIDWSKRSAYTSMGDIDWSKRNVASTLRQYKPPQKRYASPAWKYASMADADWGWKKRADESSPTTNIRDLYDIYKKNQLTSDYWKRYGQSYYQPYTSPGSYASSYVQSPQTSPYTSRGYSSSYPRTSPLVSGGLRGNRNKNKQYSYHSMADMDWGWKRKRSGPPAVSDQHREDLDEEEKGDNPNQDYDEDYELALRKLINEALQHDTEKKNIGSVTRSFDKRATQVEETNTPQGDSHDEIAPVKKNLASVASEFFDKRRSRSIAALARQGLVVTRPFHT